MFGYTLKEAIKELIFQENRSIKRAEAIKEVKETGKVTKMQYRNITGACSLGIKLFCEEHHIERLEEISIEELRKILTNDYFGAKYFWKLIDKGE